MNLHWLDWTIVAFFLIVAVVTVLVTKRYMRSVVDFLAGGRCAGRYLLSVSGMAAGTGAISVVANWESTYHAGYGAMWWGNMLAPIYLIMSLSGWVGYRYRQTRALTMAQFFEQRYSRRFRVFTGLLAYVSGVINYGIFPSIAARFLIYFAGIPEPWHVHVGGLDISLTYAALLLFLTCFSLFITLGGGQIAIMVSDFIQGMLFLIAGAILAVWCLTHFSWDQLGVAFQNAPDPEHASMINPFKTGNVKDFNLWYYLILAFSAFYNCMAWQGASGFAAAPKNPHEGRMAGVISNWRGGALAVIISFLAVCAFMVTHHPAFTDTALSAQQAIDAIGNPAYQGQATVPIILSRILPVGLLGLLCAVLLAGAVTTDNTYLHSWGTIFIQDVIMPFRKSALDPKQHIRMLRWSIVGVAAFAFCFSLIFRQTQYIYMFFAITGAIFMGGAGSVIIGGLYWSRGTTLAAWLSMIIGSVLAVGGWMIQQAPFVTAPMQISVLEARQVMVNEKPAIRVGNHWEYPVGLLSRDQWQAVKITADTPAGRAERTVYYACGTTPVAAPVVKADAPGPQIDALPANLAVVTLPDTPLGRTFVALRTVNGQLWFGIAMGASILTYVVISLLGRKRFDMDRLLHRGRYAIQTDQAVGQAEAPRGWKAVFGITAEFTRSDKVIYYVTSIWSFFWIAAFLVLLIVNLLHVQSDHFWLKYNEWYFYVQLAAGMAATVWLCVGGVRDLRDLFHILATAKRNDADDGRVADRIED